MHITGELVEMMQKVRPTYFKQYKVLQGSVAWVTFCMILIPTPDSCADCISHTVQTEDL